MKKIFYALGALTVTTAPVVAVVSCGTTKKVNITQSNNTPKSTFDDSRKRGENEQHEKSLKDMLGEARYNTYKLSAVSDFLRKYTVGSDNNTWISEHKDDFVSKYGTLFSQSAKADSEKPFFSAKISSTGISNITALDAKFEDKAAIIPTENVSSSSIEEATQKAFDMVDKYEADLKEMFEAVKKDVVSHYTWTNDITPLSDDQKFAYYISKTYTRFSAPYDSASKALDRNKEVQALADQLEKTQSKNFIFHINQNNDGSYNIEFFQMKNWVDLDAQGFPIHKATQIGDMSVGSVVDHLRNYLTISTENHQYKDFDYMMRFGDDDLWAKYFLDDTKLWSAHGTHGEVRPDATDASSVTKSRMGWLATTDGNNTNGYKSGNGWARFNTHFQIFINAYFDFEDFTKLNIEFQVNDDVYPGQNALMKFGQIPNINVANFTHGSIHGQDANKEHATAALKELLNFGVNPHVTKEKFNTVAKYIDAQTVKFLSEVSQSENVQKWAADASNMEKLYEAAKAYPGIDVDVLATQLSAIKAGNVEMWFAFDNKQKWNVLLGLRFIQWYINKNVVSATN